MWEILHSLHMIRSGQGGLVFDGWRRHLTRHARAHAAVVPPRRQVSRRGARGVGQVDVRDGTHGASPPDPERSVGPSAPWRALLALAPPFGYSPDFLTPATGTADVREGIETVVRTPRRLLRHDLERLSVERRLPEWGRHLAAGDVAVRTRLGCALHAYFTFALAPHWAKVRGQTEGEVNRLARLMATRGPERMLSGLSPFMKWEPPVLSLSNKHGERDIYLDGRGLLLQPSFFAYGDSTTLQVADQSMVLAYPVPHQIGWFDANTDTARRPLYALLGRTRAHALELLAGRACTTTELAGLLGLSIASASQHAKVLREAGIVISTQCGKAVVHRPSMLGRRLLEGSYPEPDPLPAVASVPAPAAAG